MPVGSVRRYQERVRLVLSLPAEDMVICGMALGFEDRDAVQNGLQTLRVALSDLTTFHD